MAPYIFTHVVFNYKKENPHLEAPKHVPLVRGKCIVVQ